MLNWKRTPWLAAVTLCTVLAIAAGCGDDDDDGNGDDLVLRDGTWNLTSTFTLNGTQEECTGTFGPTTLPLMLCDIANPDDITGGDGECDSEVDGNDIEFHCTEMETAGGCTFTTHTDGSGTFEETSFSMSVTSFVTVSPNNQTCNAMSQADPCTTSYNITGTWSNATGCPSKGTIPASTLFRAAGQLAGTR